MFSDALYTHGTVDACARDRENMPADRVVLLSEDFSQLALGPIPNAYSPWGEYHCRTDQGRLGRWAEATVHHSWRRGGPAWHVAEDCGRRVMEQRLFAELSAHRDGRCPLVQLPGAG